MNYKLSTLVFVAVQMTAVVATANSEVQRLLDSYVIAKVETEQPPMSTEEIQKTPYTIQVASYISEKDAVSHVEELKLQEKDVMHFPSFVRGQVWFKVCVGKFESKEAAENYRKKFIKRMDEPFAVTISLLDRPKSDDKRMPASVVKKEAAPLPLEKPVASAVEPTIVLKPSALKPQAKTVEAAPAGEVKVAAVAPTSATGKLENQGDDPTKWHHIYSLQVGAYPNAELASKKIKQLTVKDQDVFVQEASVNGQTWHRVFVGKFKTKRLAEDFQKLFADQVKVTDSFVRKLDQ